MKTLNVVKTNPGELAKKWGFYPSLPNELYIRCNQKGVINWEIAPVYTWKEIQQEQQKRPVHFLVPPETFEI